MSGKRFNSKTIGIRVSMTDGNHLNGLLSVIDTKMIVEHLVHKFAAHLPERIFFKRNNAEGTLKVEGKKIRMVSKPWTETVSDNNLIFELVDLQLRNSKRNFFELEWRDAVNDSTTWLTWQSLEYDKQSFNEKLESMTETERVLALKAKYGDKFVDRPVGKILSNLEKLEKAKQEISTVMEEESFEYTFPQRINELFGPSNKIYQWFKENVLPTELKRRKFLVLYSEERELGKTEFVKDLVNQDYSRYIYVSGRDFHEKNFKPKENTAKILLLDDFEWSPCKEQILKQLLTSQECNIDGKYLNYNFKHGIPVVVTTNVKKQAENLATHSMTWNQCVVVCIKDFIGPPHTKPKKLERRDAGIHILRADADFSNFENAANAIPRNNDMGGGDLAEQQQEENQNQEAPSGLNENSNDSERFKEAIKREEWSSCYKGCSEEEKQGLLTRFAELNAEMQRLKALCFAQQQIPAPTTITVYNNNFFGNSQSHGLPSSALVNSNAGLGTGAEISYIKKDLNHHKRNSIGREHQHHTQNRCASTAPQSQKNKSQRNMPPRSTATNREETKNEAQGEQERFKSPVASKKVKKWEDKEKPPLDSSTRANNKNFPSNRACPVLFIPGATFDGLQLMSLTEITELLSETKLRKLLTWVHKREAAAKAGANQMEMETYHIHHLQEEDNPRDRHSFPLFHRYFLCCKKTNIRVGNDNEEEPLLAVQVSYFSAKRMKRSKHGAFGRLYSGAQCVNLFNPTAAAWRQQLTGTMQNFEKKTRAYLCEDIYWDLDQVNSHPSLLISLLMHLKIEIPSLLQRYVEDRSKVLAQLAASYGTDAATAKKLMIRLMYGGTIQNWRVAHQLLSSLPSDPELEQELVWFSEGLSTINEKLQRIPLFATAVTVYHETYERSERTTTSFLSLICSEYERQVLLFVKRWLSQQTPPRELDVLIHDGGLMRRLPGEIEPPRSLLADLNQELQKHFQTFYIKYSFKSFEDVLTATIRNEIDQEEPWHF